MAVIPKISGANPRRADQRVLYMQTRGLACATETARICRLDLSP